MSGTGLDRPQARAGPVMDMLLVDLAVAAELDVPPATDCIHALQIVDTHPEGTAATDILLDHIEIAGAVIVIGQRHLRTVHRLRVDHGGDAAQRIPAVAGQIGGAVDGGGNRGPAPERIVAILLDEAGGGTAERCRHPLRQAEQGTARRMESPGRRTLARVAALNQPAELVITEADGVGRRERIGLTDEFAEGIPGRAATTRIRRLHAGLPTTLVVVERRDDCHWHRQAC